MERITKALVVALLLALGACGDETSNPNVDAMYAGMKELRKQCKDRAKTAYKTCKEQCGGNNEYFNDAGVETCPKRCGEWYDQQVDGCQ